MNDELDKIMPTDALKKRDSEDLDSLTVGSESTCKCKIYFNSKTDTEEQLLPRIDMALAGAEYLKRKMVERGLIK